MPRYTHTFPPTPPLSSPEDRAAAYRHKQVGLMVMCVIEVKVQMYICHCMHTNSQYAAASLIFITGSCSLVKF